MLKDLASHYDLIEKNQTSADIEKNKDRVAYLLSGYRFMYEVGPRCVVSSALRFDLVVLGYQRKEWHIQKHFYQEDN